MRYCSVKNCSTKSCDGISLHGFRKDWLVLSEWKNENPLYVCSRHFDTYDMCSFSVHQIETHRKLEKNQEIKKNRIRKNLSRLYHLSASVDFSYYNLFNTYMVHTYVIVISVKIKRSFTCNNRSLILVYPYDYTFFL